MTVVAAKGTALWEMQKTGMTSGLRTRNNVSTHKRVERFHSKYSMPHPNQFTTLTPEREAMRVELIREEYEELLEGLRNNDPIEVIDALGDLVYVCHGMAVEMGVNLDDVIQEIHASNMTKLGQDGKPIYREDGKVLKGPNYKAPRIDITLGLAAPEEVA